MRINLFFRTFKDPVLEQKVADFDMIRLQGFIRFKTKNSWSKPYDAIIDTGAPISLIPYYIWNKVEHIEIADYKVFGVAGKEECSIPVKIGKVIAELFDEQYNRVSNIEMHTYLAMINEVPLIVGFKDLLSRFKVCFEYKKREAWLEKRE